MFSSLPRRCVVLLEDIDSAGLTKRQEEGENYAKPADDAATKIGAEKVEPEALIEFDQGNLMLTTQKRLVAGLTWIFSEGWHWLILSAPDHSVFQATLSLGF